MVGDTWSPTASMRTLKYLLSDSAKHKAIVHQIDFIGAFLQANVKDRVFVKLDNTYEAYFPEYSQYFGRALKFLKSMYGMTNSGKLFADYLTEWLVEEGFIQSTKIKQSNMLTKTACICGHSAELNKHKTCQKEQITSL